MKIFYGNVDVSKYIVSYRKKGNFIDGNILGQVPTYEIEIEVNNKDKIFDDMSKEFFVYEDNNNQTGIFNIYEKPEKYTSIIKFVLYDNMIKLNKFYETSLDFSKGVLVREVLDDIAVKSGLTIIYDNLPGHILNKSIIWYDNTLPMIDYVGWIAEIAGTNASANNLGKIVFNSISSTYEFELERVGDLEVEDSFIISNVCFDNGDVQFISGTSENDTLFLNANNPFIDDQSIVDYLCEKYSGYRFTNISTIKFKGDRNIRLGNVIKYLDYQFIVTSLIADEFGGESYPIYTAEGIACDLDTSENYKSVEPSIKYKYIEADLGRFKDLTTLNLNAINASVSGKLEASVFEAYKATIDEAYMTKAEIESAYITEANIKSYIADQGYVTNLQVNTLLADKVTTSQLDAATARITTLESTTVKANELQAKVGEFGYLKASEAELTYATITNLNSTNANIASISGDLSTYKKTVTEELETRDATIDELIAKDAEIDNALIKKASVDELNAVSARIKTLETDTLKTNELSAEVAKLGYATISSLNATNANISNLQSELAQIDEAKIEIADVETLLAKKAYLDEAQVNTLIVKKGYLTEAQVETLVASKGYITSLEVDDLLADKVTTNDLSAAVARISSLETNTLKTKDLSTEVAKLGYATVTELNAAKGRIDTLEADTVKTGELESVVATFGYLKATTASATYATITNLNSTNASVSKLQADLAEIDAAKIGTADVETLLADKAYLTEVKARELYATIANFNTLSATVGNINTLLAGSVVSGSTQTIVLNASNTTIANALIKDAMIDSLSFSKISGVDINTTNLNIHSNDGKSTWKDNTIQIKDANRTRVQIGKDSDGDYNIYIWDANGNLMFDPLGLTDAGVNREVIDNANVKENAAIHGSKLDIDSVVEEVNGSNKTIKSSKIHFDEKNQTLDVLFSQISNQIETNTTAISVSNGNISSLITKVNQTEESMTNKYNALNADVSSIRSTIGEHTSSLGSLTNRVSSFEQNLNGFQATVSNTYVTKDKAVKEIKQFYCYPMGVVLEETSAIYAGEMEFALTVPVIVEGGRTYTVIWNGVAYPTKCVEVNEDGLVGQILGDYGLLTGGESTGEPFVMVVFPDGTLEEAGYSSLLLAIDGSTSITISILGGKSSSVPNKPTSYPPTSEWFETEQVGTGASQFSTVCTVYADDTFSYSDVTVSNVNEMAMDAYGKAEGAEVLYNSYATRLADAENNIWTNSADIQTLNTENQNIKNNLSNVTNRLSTAETKITQNTNAIELRATKTEVAETLKGYSTTSQMEAAIKTSKDGILSTVSNTYATQTSLATVDGKFANYSTTSDMNTAINLKANEITSTVSSTYATKESLNQVNGKFANYSTTVSMNAAIEQKANSITATVEKTYQKTVSKGEQLITNGSGLMGDNTNFSTWTFDGAITNNSAGSFTKSAGSAGTYISDEYFPVNPLQEYTFSFDVKSAKGVGRLYSMFVFYDADQNQITAGHHIYNVASTTTLARELKAGDTVIYLTNAAGFSTTFNYGFYMIIWNYKNKFGYTYPAGTYSRNRITLPKTSANKLDSNCLNTSANTITLSAAYTGATIPAGTSISQGGDGGIYKYFPCSNTLIQTMWTNYSGKISGIDYSGQNISNTFPPGTAYAKLGFLWNYQGSGNGEQLWVTNLSVTDTTAVSKVQTAADKAQSDVNSLSTRVTQTENSIKSQATSISGYETRISTVEQTANGLTISLQTAQSTADTALSRGVEYIEGTQTAATNAWTGKTTDTSLVKGKTIAYKLPYAGNSSAATLNLTLAGGGTTGAKEIRRLDSTVTTNYVAGSVVHMTYDGTYWRITDYNSDTYDRVRYNKAIKCGTTPIVAANIIVGTGGLYKHLKEGTAFDVSYPILYASSAIAASATGTNNYLCYSFTVTTTQSITLTAYKPVYIKGTLSGTTFTPVSTSPLTQTVPTSNDGYYYILLGHAITSTTMYLTLEHPIYTYFNGSFKAVSQIAVEAAKTATNYMNFSSAGLVVGDMTASTLGRNVLIASNSVDIRSGSTVLASFQSDKIELGKNSKSSVIDLCGGIGRITSIDGTASLDTLSISSVEANGVQEGYSYFSGSGTTIGLKNMNTDAGSRTRYTVGEVVTEVKINTNTVKSYLSLNSSTAIVYAPSVTIQGENDGVVLTGGTSSSLYVQKTYTMLASPYLCIGNLLGSYSTQANVPYLKWVAWNNKNPYIGYASDQSDGTFVIGSLLGTNYASGLAIGGGSGNLLWKGARVATATDLAGYSTTNHTHSNYSLTSHTHSEYALSNHSHTLDYRLQAAQSTAIGADANLATQTGFHYVNGTTNRPPFSQSTNNDYRILTTAYNETWLQQIATDFRCDDIFYRRNQSGTWQNWRRLAFYDECAPASHTHSYLPLSGGTLTSVLNISSDRAQINLRPGHASYDGVISYQTSGNEAMIFSTKQAVTSFIFVNGEDIITNMSSSRWQSLKPGLQIKQNCVAIGKLIANGVTPAYTLDVQGTANITEIYENGVALSGKYMAKSPASIELAGASGNGGYIDFHFGQSTADNTSRIIESSSGVLNINGTVFTKTDSGSRLTAAALYKTSTTYPVYGCRTLYSNTTGTTGNVTLAESAANFTYIIIIVGFSDTGASGSLVVYSPNGKTVDVGALVAVSNGASIGRVRYSISGTTMSVVSGSNYIAKVSSGSWSYTANGVYCKAVLGFK